MSLINFILKKTRTKKYAVKFAHYFVFNFLYPAYYKIKSRKTINENKVVFIEVRVNYLTADFKLLYNTLEKEDKYDLYVFYLENMKKGRKAYIKRCLRMLEQISDAKYVFLSDACNVTSCIDLRKETIITQVWHACGAFKQFGMSTSEKLFGSSKKQLENYPNYKNLKYVTVSSEEVIWAYKEAMDIKDDKTIQATGISRTDCFFDNNFINNSFEKFYQQYNIKNKKIILYAPTFRGRVATAYSPRDLDIRLLKELLGDEYILLLKQHPFVKKAPKIDVEDRDFAIDVTRTFDIDELICISDFCISDYSSIIFEYSLFERPMIFFVPDIEEFEDWRGFYYDLSEIMPGPKVTTTKELATKIIELDKSFDKGEIHEFKNKFMNACDGNATKRIINMVFK